MAAAHAADFHPRRTKAAADDDSLPPLPPLPSAPPAALPLRRAPSPDPQPFDGALAALSSGLAYISALLFAPPRHAERKLTDNGLPMHLPVPADGTVRSRRPSGSSSREPDMDGEDEWDERASERGTGHGYGHRARPHVTVQVPGHPDRNGVWTCSCPGHFV